MKRGGVLSYWTLFLLGVSLHFSRILYNIKAYIRDVYLVTGNPPNMNLQNCTTLLPLSSSGASGPLASPPMQPYLILHELLNIRDSLLQATTLSFDIAAQPSFGIELQ